MDLDAWRTATVCRPLTRPAAGGCDGTKARRDDGFPVVDHAVIGLMDPAHGPFVHQSWWWRSEASIHEKAKTFGPVSWASPCCSTPSSNSAGYKILGGNPTTEISFPPRHPGGGHRHGPACGSRPNGCHADLGETDAHPPHDLLDDAVPVGAEAALDPSRASFSARIRMLSSSSRGASRTIPR